MRTFFGTVLLALTVGVSTAAAATKPVNVMPDQPFSIPAAKAFGSAVAARAKSSGWTWDCLALGPGYHCDFINPKLPGNVAMPSGKPVKYEGALLLTPWSPTPGCPNVTTRDQCIQAMATTCQYVVYYFDGSVGDTRATSTMDVNVCKSGWTKQAMALETNSP